MQLIRTRWTSSSQRRRGATIDNARNVRIFPQIFSVARLADLLSGWKRKADGARLMVCSSCKITSYCVSPFNTDLTPYSRQPSLTAFYVFFSQSITCQKADWQFHKEACKTNSGFRRSMALQDELERLDSYVHNTRPRPSTLQVNGEMGEFLKRFRPVLCQASYRCFGVQQGHSDAWRHNVFVVTIARLDDPPEDSRPWARYTVVDAKATRIAELVDELGEDALRPTLKQGEVYHEENVRVGCVGTIMTFLECTSAGHQIQLVSWAGYGPETWEEGVPCPDWKGALIDAVERISGRGVSKCVNNRFFRSCTYLSLVR